MSRSETKNQITASSVVIHPHLNQTKEIKQLCADFSRYKKGLTSNVPLFGRDVPFTDDSSLDMHDICKVHVISEGAYQHKNSQYNNTSNDAHLIYCLHPKDASYICIIDIVTPEAHKKARNHGIVKKWCNLAQKFSTIDPE